MGNQRSGRRPGTKSKPVVEDCAFIDVREWMRGRLPDSETPDYTENRRFKLGAITAYIDYCRDARGPYIRLRYRIPDHTDWLDYKVRILSTVLHSGGRRWWLVCRLGPGICNRRAQRLYLPSGALYFGCRYCHRLSYASQGKATKRRRANFQNPAAENDGSAASPALPETLTSRPKGMWKKTYRRFAGSAEQRGVSSSAPMIDPTIRPTEGY